MLEACVDLGCDAEMVAIARRFVAHTLRLWEVDDGHLDAAVLLTSELTANAVLHARTDVRVTVRSRDDGTVRVEVADENPRIPIAVTPPEEAQSGRGLSLVAAFATIWGIEQTPTGKAVWFELGAFRRPDHPEPCLDITEAGSVHEALDQIEALTDMSTEQRPRVQG